MLHLASVSHGQELEDPLLRQAEELANELTCPEDFLAILKNAARAYVFIAKRAPTRSELFMLKGSIMAQRDRLQEPGLGELIASQVFKKLTSANQQTQTKN